MKKEIRSRKHLEEFEQYLKREEKSPATCEKYLRDVWGFLSYLAETQEQVTGRRTRKKSLARSITEEFVLDYKQYLIDEGRSTSTINCELSAIRAFLKFLGRGDIHVKNMRCQRTPYVSEKKMLERDEYEKLIAKAKEIGREKYVLLLESICATGIRVSELEYITVEAVKKGEAEVILKGKTRRILIPERLRKKLIRYAAEKKITSGSIFINGIGIPVHRSYVWQVMKSLAIKAGIDPEKAFPHNLRRLFARTFYEEKNDIAKLADVLGHSSIDTTRIYIATPASEHIRILDKLDLVT